MSAKEQMPLVIRYVSPAQIICGNFVGFIHCDTGLSGEALSSKILAKINQLGLLIQNCMGQGYDGAGAMSSPEVGVAAFIRRVAQYAIYVHCNSHKLNLCVAKSCEILQVKNMIDNAAALTWFFKFSGLHNAID